MGRMPRKDRVLFLIFLTGIILLLQSSIHSRKRDSRPEMEEHEFSEYGVEKTKSKIPQIPTKDLYNTKVINGNARQEARKNIQRKQCRTLGGQYKGTLPDSILRGHLLFDNKTKLVFCHLPKVGSTFLKQVLHILSGHKKVKNPFAISGNDAHTLPFSSFQEVSIDEALRSLQESTKFLFVRNPYSRLLSGYVDKLFTVNFVFWDTTGKVIIKGQRLNPSETSIKCGHDSTFAEFVKHVIHSEKNKKHRNPHWYPMYDACRPCNLNYDVIGKIETFQQDIEMFLKSHELFDKVNISNMNQENDKEAISLTVTRAYETLQKKQKCLTLPQALERAWKVLQVRGVLSHKAQFPYGQIRGHPNISKQAFLGIVNKEMTSLPMTKRDKTLAREQAIANAWGSLSQNELDEFQSIFHPDFVVFGYIKSIPKKHKNFLNWEPFKLKL